MRIILYTCVRLNNCLQCGKISLITELLQIVIDVIAQKGNE